MSVFRAWLWLANVSQAHKETFSDTGAHYHNVQSSVHITSIPKLNQAFLCFLWFLCLLLLKNHQIYQKIKKSIVQLAFNPFLYSTSKFWNPRFVVSDPSLTFIFIRIQRWGLAPIPGPAVLGCRFGTGFVNFVTRGCVTRSWFFPRTGASRSLFLRWIWRNQWDLSGTSLSRVQEVVGDGVVFRFNFSFTWLRKSSVLAKYACTKYQWWIEHSTKQQWNVLALASENDVTLGLAGRHLTNPKTDISWSECVSLMLFGTMGFGRYPKLNMYLKFWKCFWEKWVLGKLEKTFFFIFGTKLMIFQSRAYRS